MTNKTFDELLANRLTKISEVLGTKAREYAAEGDRLHNFSVASRTNGNTKPEALWGMATKHLVSVLDLVRGNLENTPENVNEKVGDLINYLILLEAVLQEERAALAGISAQFRA